MFDDNKVKTKEEAYLLGLLYADGNVSQKYHDKYYAFQLGLKESDRDFLQEILNIFNRNFNKNVELKYCSNTKSYRFTFCNVILVQNLIKLGLIPNKSYENSSFVFINIPDEFKKDFLLGLFDGDGYFTIGKTQSKLAGIISNNQSLLDSISNFINSCLGENFSKVKLPTQGDPYPRIRFSADKAKIFGDWLYKDSVAFCLKRKKDNYLKFGSVCGKEHFGWDNYITKGIFCIESQKIYTTAKDAALGEFNLTNPGTINCIREVCRGERKQTRGKHFRYLTQEEKENYIKYGSI